MRITGVKSFPNVVTHTLIIKSIIKEAHSRATYFDKVLDMGKLIETVITYIRTEIIETSYQ